MVSAIMQVSNCIKPQRDKTHQPASVLGVWSSWTVLVTPSSRVLGWHQLMHPPPSLHPCSRQWIPLSPPPASRLMDLGFVHLVLGYVIVLWSERAFYITLTSLWLTHTPTWAPAGCYPRPSTTHQRHPSWLEPT